MLEILSYVALGYCVGLLITFVVLTFFNGFNTKSFAGIGLIISVGLSAAWPVVVLMYINETIKGRKHK